jgi:hypothetical protein
MPSEGHVPCITSKMYLQIYYDINESDAEMCSALMRVITTGISPSKNDIKWARKLPASDVSILVTERGVVQLANGNNEWI